MKPIIRLSVGVIGAIFLTACIWDGDSPAYPEIDKVKLVGCWVAVGSGKPNGFCDERCFSSNGLFFSRYISRIIDSGTQGFVESGGTYSVKGNTVTSNVKIGNNSGNIDTNFTKNKDAYTVMRDTLYSITNNGLNLNPYARADSSNTCGPHWQVFPKPEGWELN